MITFLIEAQIIIGNSSSLLMQTTPELSHAPAPSTSKRKENTNPQFFFQKKKTKPESKKTRYKTESTDVFY